MPKPTRFHEPADVRQAIDERNARCGPIAFAAILGREVMDCMMFFPPDKTYVNPTMMTQALDAAGVPWSRTRNNEHDQAISPAYGLVFIQITGSWTNPGVPVAAAYQRTHWICFYTATDPERSLVYDANAAEWLFTNEWEANIMNALISQNKGDGWYCRQAFEVQPQ